MEKLPIILTNKQKIVDAIIKGKTSAFKILIKKDSNLVNLVSNEGVTLLHLSTHYNRKEMVEILLLQMKHKLIKAVDENGNTALHIAARAGSKDIVDILLKSRVPGLIDIVNDNNKTALQEAAENKEIIEIILKSKEDLAAKHEISKAKKIKSLKAEEKKFEHKDSQMEDECALPSFYKDDKSEREYALPSFYEKFGLLQMDILGAGNSGYANHDID